MPYQVLDTLQKYQFPLSSPIQAYIQPNSRNVQGAFQIFTIFST